MAGGEVLAELILEGDREFRSGMERSQESVDDLKDSTQELDGPTDDAARSVDNLGRQADESSGKLATLSSKIKGAKGKMRGMGKRGMRVGKKMTMGLTLPLAGAAGASLKLASDTEEMQSKMSTVFGDLTDDIEDWSEVQADATNRSKYQFQEMATQLQDTFVPMGFARDEAAEMSKELSTLATDLGSFNNMDTDQALNKLRSGLTGNHRALREFGVMINQATLEQKLMEEGMADSIQAASEQEKMMARLAIVQESTKDAQGDAARTADSFANQMRGLKAQLKEAAVVMGKELMPYAKDLLSFVKPLIKRFTNMNDRSKRFTLVAAGLAAVLGPLIGVVGALTFAIGAISTPVLVAVGAIGALAAIAFTFREELNPLWNALQQGVTIFRENLPVAIRKGKEGLQAFREFIQPTIDRIKPLISMLRQEFITTMEVVNQRVQRILGFMQSQWEKHGEKVMAVITPLANIVRLTVENMMDVAITTIRAGLALIRGDFGGFADIILNFFGRFGDRVKEAGGSLIDALINGIKLQLAVIPDLMQQLGEKIMEYLPGSDADKGPLSNLTESGKGFITAIVNGIKANAGKVKEAVKDAAKEARKYLPFSDAKAGPFSELTDSGEALSQTFAKGITDNKEAPSRATAEMAQLTKEELNKARPGDGAGGGGGFSKSKLREAKSSAGGEDGRGYEVVYPELAREKDTGSSQDKIRGGGRFGNAVAQDAGSSGSTMGTYGSDVEGSMGQDGITVEMTVEEGALQLSGVLMPEAKKEIKSMMEDWEDRIMRKVDRLWKRGRGM